MRPSRFSRVACASAVLALSMQTAAAAPFTPADDTMVLERLPEGQDASVRELRRLQASLGAAPHDRALAVRVAQGDIALARRNADPRWLGRAEAALAPWPVGPGAPADTTLLHATILQSNHDFPASLAALALVLAADPSDAQALLTRASVETVRADYPAALHDCGQLASGVLGLAPDTCTASIMAVTGHAPLALRALSISLVQNAAEPVATRAWAATLAAEIADRLDDPSADARFVAALRLAPTDPYLLGARADWLLDHDRAADVVALLSPYTRIDPLLLRQALAERRLGMAEAAGHIVDLAARFEAARLRGDTVHRREEARFTLALLHRPAAALVLARADWQVQREPADALILLQTAVAASDPSAAAPVLTWMREHDVQDVALARLAAALKQES